MLIFTNKARGLRNNNPLNIRKTGDQWQGAAINQNDKSFVVFTKPEWGYRAAARILRNYKNRGIDTLSEIISTWAPEHENNTAAYVSFVSKKTGISPNAVVTDLEYPALLDAMTIMENGSNPYSMDVIKKGIAWA